MTKKQGTYQGDVGVFDANGSTVTIHESPDDHVTQPIGGTGGRVGWGIFRSLQQPMPPQHCLAFWQPQPMVMSSGRVRWLENRAEAGEAPDNASAARMTAAAV